MPSFPVPSTVHFLNRTHVEAVIGQMPVTSQPEAGLRAEQSLLLALGLKNISPSGE